MRWLSVLCVSLALGAAGCGGNSDVNFDAAAWKAVHDARRCDTTDQNQVRKHMVKDLIDTRLRRGMTQRELKTLLGPPEEEGSSAGTINWYWYTGNDGTDCTVLIVGLVDGRVDGSREGRL